MDIIISFNAWGSLKFTQILRYLLKFSVAAAWVVVFLVGYVRAIRDPDGLMEVFSNWEGDWRNRTLYNYAVAIYMIPNVLSALLFLLPPVRRKMEKSNWRVITFILWWAQARIS